MKVKKIFGLLSAWVPAAILLFWVIPSAQAAYADVPSNALGKEVQKAVEYGLMSGYSNTVFGYSDSMTRAQFVTVLDRLLLYDADSAVLPASMALPDTLSDVYRTALTHAVAAGVVDSSSRFEPDTPITRQEMAEMLVKALGLDTVALSLSSPAPPHPNAVTVSPFLDLPKGREGYASIAYAIGMTKGTSETTFSPNENATRAQVAAMVVRIYEKIHQKTAFRHAFYGPSSVTQLERAKQMDVVSMEWSRMTWSNAEARLSVTSANQNEYYIPPGYGNLVTELSESGVKLYLSVFMDATSGLTELLSSEHGKTEAVEQILHELTVPYPALNRNPYSGVTIDFEGVRSEQKESFTDFLSELRAALPTGKGMYVCIAPYLSGLPLSAAPPDDGYDCAAIARIADKLIVAAYGYDTRNLNNFLGTEAYKNEPPAPLDYVYLALWKLTKEVSDASKLLLGISFRNAAWEINREGALISGTSVFLDAETLEESLNRHGTKNGWSASYQIPFAACTTPQDSHYFVWYENAVSVRKKGEIARLLGISGVSCWRLGIIPSGISF